MATILEFLRTRVVTWVQNATMEQLGKLPGEIFGTTATIVNANGSKSGRIRKHTRKAMTRADGDTVRLKLESFERNSPKYFKERDRIAREMGFSRRQIAAAVSGLERAAKRKKSGKK